MGNTMPLKSCKLLYGKNYCEISKGFLFKGLYPYVMGKEMKHNE